MTVKSGLAHLCHHDRHWEYCYDFDERVAYIKENKPKSEIDTRLKWFQLVPAAEIPGKDSELWEAHDKAWEAHNKAWEAYSTAWKAYDKAKEAHNKAWKAHSTAWEAHSTAWEAHSTAWKAYSTAWEAYDKAKEAHSTTWEACDKARIAYIRKYAPELDKVHGRLFPGCPWNGQEYVPLSKGVVGRLNKGGKE